MHVYPLYGTATLSGIENSSVHELLCDVLHVGIWPNICRIISTELEVDGLDVLGDCLPESDSTCS